jgi:hypothetical protein
MRNATVPASALKKNLLFFIFYLVKRRVDGMSIDFFIIVAYTLSPDAAQLFAASRPKPLFVSVIITTYFP